MAANVCDGIQRPCSGTATQASPGDVHPGNDAHQVAVGFEALLFEAALKPLARSMGFFGDVAASAMARGLAEHNGGAFTARLEVLVQAAGG